MWPALTTPRSKGEREPGDSSDLVWGRPSDGILDAFEAAGKDVDTLARDDIASFDEFHIRGLDATREVAEIAGIGTTIASSMSVVVSEGPPVSSLTSSIAMSSESTWSRRTAGQRRCLPTGWG